MSKVTIKQLEALTAQDDGKVFREDGGLVAEVRAGVRGDDVDVTGPPDEQRVGVIALPVDDPLEGGGVLATLERGRG